MLDQASPSFVLFCAAASLAGVGLSLIAGVLAWRRNPSSRWVAAGALLPAGYMVFRAALLAWWDHIRAGGVLRSRSILPAYGARLVAESYAADAANARVACALALLVVALSILAFAVRVLRSSPVPRAERLIAACAMILPLVLVPATYAYAHGPSEAEIRATMEANQR